MFFSTCDCCIILKLAMSKTCLDTVHLLPNPASEERRKDIESMKGIPNLLLSTRQGRWAIGGHDNKTGGLPPRCCALNMSYGKRPLSM